MSTPAMTYKSLGWHATVPAGAYFLGDPCYAVPGGAWDALLQTCDVFTTPVGTVLGHDVLAFRSLGRCCAHRACATPRPFFRLTGPPVRFVQIRPLGSIPIAAGSCKSALTLALGQSDSHQIA